MLQHLYNHPRYKIIPTQQLNTTYTTTEFWGPTQSSGRSYIHVGDLIFSSINGNNFDLIHTTTGKFVGVEILKSGYYHVTMVSYWRDTPEIATVDMNSLMILIAHNNKNDLLTNPTVITSFEHATTLTSGYSKVLIEPIIAYLNAGNTVSISTQFRDNIEAAKIEYMRYYNTKLQLTYQQEVVEL